MAGQVLRVRYNAAPLRAWLTEVERLLAAEGDTARARDLTAQIDQHMGWGGIARLATRRDGEGWALVLEPSAHAAWVLGRLRSWAE